jgi:hypothetical protein
MTRPRKHHPRQHQVNMRFDTAEYARIHHHALLTGKTLTDFGRSVMLRRPRRRRTEPAFITLSPSAMARWQSLGARINGLAHDLNAHQQLDPRALSVAARSLRLHLHRCFPGHFDATTPVAPYRLAPLVRYQLRRICTNLVQIADRYRALGLVAPLPLAHLIYRFRAVMNGDAALHGS